MTIHDDPRFAAVPDGDRDLEDFRRFGDEVLALLTLYVQHSRAGEGPVLRQRPLSEVSGGLDLERWIRERMIVGNVVDRWSGQIMEPADGLAFLTSAINRMGPDAANGVKKSRILGASAIFDESSGISDSVRNPCATVGPNGDAAAISGSTWIDCSSSVHAAKASIRP